MRKLTPKQQALLDRLEPLSGNALGLTGAKKVTAEALVRRGLAMCIGEDWRHGRRYYVRVADIKMKDHAYA